MRRSLTTLSIPLKQTTSAASSRIPAGIPLLLLIAGGLLFGLCAALTASKSVIGLLPIAAVFGFVGAFLFISRPHWIFWLMVATGLFNDKLFVSLGGLNVRAYLGLTAIGVAGIVVHTLQNRTGRIPRRACRFAIPFLPLFLMMGAKVVTWQTIAEFPLGMPSSYPLKHLFFACLLYTTGYITAVFLPSGRALEKALALWIILLAASALLGLIQTILANSIHSFHHLVHMRDVIFYGRAFSVFREPDVFGSLMAAAVMTIAPLLIFRVPLLPVKLLWACLGICTLMLLMLFVRAAWLASIVAVGFATLMILRSGRFVVLLPHLRRGVLAAVAGMVALIILAPGVVEGLTDRVGSLANPEEEGASAYRIQDLDAMIAKVTPSGPLAEGFGPFVFGHGDMSWSYWAPHLIGDSYDDNALRLLRNHGIVSMHPGFCMFLAIAFDNGIVGLGLVLLFFGWTYLRVVRSARIARRLPKPQCDRMLGLVLATSLPVLCILVCFQFSYDPGSPFFWIMIGFLLAALDQIERRQTLSAC